MLLGHPLRAGEGTEEGSDERIGHLGVFVPRGGVPPCIVPNPFPLPGFIIRFPLPGFIIRFPLPGFIIPLPPPIIRRLPRRVRILNASPPEQTSARNRTMSKQHKPFRFIAATDRGVYHKT